MKTVTDLNALIPAILEAFRKDDREYGDGYSKNNTFHFEEDGWFIDVEYDCTGDFVCDHGDYWTPPCHDMVDSEIEVGSISVYFCDDETGEEKEFSEEDTKELLNALEVGTENMR